MAPRRASEILASFHEGQRHDASPAQAPCFHLRHSIPSESDQNPLFLAIQALGTRWNVVRRRNLLHDPQSLVGLPWPLLCTLNRCSTL